MTTNLKLTLWHWLCFSVLSNLHRNCWICLTNQVCCFGPAINRHWWFAMKEHHLFKHLDFRHLCCILRGGKCLIQIKSSFTPSLTAIWPWGCQKHMPCAEGSVSAKLSACKLFFCRSAYPLHLLSSASDLNPSVCARWDFPHPFHFRESTNSSTKREVWSEETYLLL